MYRKETRSVEAPADAHVDTADKHDSAGQKTPKEQIELCSLRLVGDHCMKIVNVWTVYGLQIIRNTIPTEMTSSPHPPSYVYHDT